MIDVECDENGVFSIPTGLFLKGARITVVPSTAPAEDFVVTGSIPFNVPEPLPLILPKTRTPPKGAQWKNDRKPFHRR